MSGKAESVRRLAGAEGALRRVKSAAGVEKVLLAGALIFSFSACEPGGGDAPSVRELPSVRETAPVKAEGAPGREVAPVREEHPVKEVAPAANPAANAARERPSAADFSLPAVNGGIVSLSGLKGKVVVVDFWAMWCRPCVWEIPSFVKLKHRYAADGFEIIGLSVDRDRSRMAEFIRRYGINYPIVYADGELQEKYGGIRGIPTTFFIDKRGRIAEKVVGAHEESFFDGKIRELLMEED
jgi:peroxiredoxin